MRSNRWVQRSLRVILTTATIVLVSGAVLEQLARARVADVAMPGRLVDIGSGRRIQLDCRGSGSPTVVLESGLDTFGSLAWAAVHDSIARTTRTCAYSRAGVMWSDPADGDFDSRNAARDLHAALIAGGETAPWLMVGHSIGGPYVITFTQLFGAEVAGLVIVDGSHPDQFARFSEITGKSLVPSATVPRIAAALAWTGLVRALPATPSPPSWPGVIGSVTPRFLPMSVAVPSTLDHAAQARLLGDRPLIVLTAALGLAPADLHAMGLTLAKGEQMQQASRALQQDMASWSRRGQNRLVEASHYIQFDRPAAVIEAVREVVESTRSAS
jgi:pimeloyl-ACP methyl ester carboxylesterase